MERLVAHLAGKPVGRGEEGSEEGSDSEDEEMNHKHAHGQAFVDRRTAEGYGNVIQAADLILAEVCETCGNMGIRAGIWECVLVIFRAIVLAVGGLH